MTEQEIIDFVNVLSDNGIRLTTVYDPVGCDFTLKAKDIMRFLDNRDAFFADECGLLLEDYIEWRNYLKNGCLCTATTKNGTCSRTISGARDLAAHEYFSRKKLGTLKCSRHVDKKV